MEGTFCIVSKDLPMHACKDAGPWYDVNVV